MTIPPRLQRRVRASRSSRSVSGALRAAFVAVLALVAPSGGVGCGRAGEKASAAHGPPPATVEVVDVVPRTLVEQVDLVGQLEAEESVQIRSELAGVIEGIGFREGQEVAKGDVLFRLRDAEQRARLHEAQATLALARDVYQRTQALAQRNVAAAAQREKASAELAQAEARLELASVTLERTTIEAPFDGVMGARQVSPGDRIDSKEPLGEIHAVKRLVLRFTLPEVAVLLAKQGARLEFGVAPYPGETFHGEVFFVSPTLDPTTRRMQLKAYVPNDDRRLRPGLFANIRVEIGRAEGALVVPEDAIAYDPTGSFVWRVGADSKAERVPVELGSRRDGLVQVKTGLAPGDRIVAGGTHKVTPGGTIVPAPAAPAAAEQRAAADPPDGA